MYLIPLRFFIFSSSREKFIVIIAYWIDERKAPSKTSLNYTEWKPCQSFLGRARKQDQVRNVISFRSGLEEVRILMKCSC